MIHSPLYLVRLEERETPAGFFKGIETIMNALPPVDPTSPPVSSPPSPPPVSPPPTSPPTPA